MRCRLAARPAKWLSIVRLVEGLSLLEKIKLTGLLPMKSAWVPQ
jgi:hypothetical protein